MLPACAAAIAVWWLLRIQAKDEKVRRKAKLPEREMGGNNVLGARTPSAAYFVWVGRVEILQINISEGILLHALRISFWLDERLDVRAIL